MTLSTIAVTGSLFAYDGTNANYLNGFYSHMTQKACADSTLFLTGDAVMKMFKDGKKFIMIDVRTEAEAGIVSLSSKNSKHIPIARLFEKENLDTLPTDIPIVIVCHSGTRATFAAMGLKQIGFADTHVLKGGLIALAESNTPKAAPMK